MQTHIRTTDRRGFSLLELVAVVTLIGIIALIAIPRYFNNAIDAKRSACSVNKHSIEIQTQLWFRQKGAAPNADLSVIGSNRAYFPDGAVPRCPVDNSAYTINTTTLQVVGHTH